MNGCRIRSVTVAPTVGRLVPEVSTKYTSANKSLSRSIFVMRASDHSRNFFVKASRYFLKSSRGGGAPRLEPFFAGTVTTKNVAQIFPL